MTETPQQAGDNPHDDDLDVEGPNESVPSTNANPQDQDAAGDGESS